MSNFDISAKTFFSETMFHPFESQKLNKAEKCLAFIASVTIGIFTLGMVHAACYIAYRTPINASYGKKLTPQDSRISTTAQQNNLTQKDQQSKPSETISQPPTGKLFPVISKPIAATPSSISNPVAATPSSTLNKNPSFNMKFLPLIYNDPQHREGLRKAFQDPAFAANFERELGLYLNSFKYDMPKDHKIIPAWKMEKFIKNINETIYKGIIELIINPNAKSHALTENTNFYLIPEIFKYLDSLVMNSVIGSYGEKRLHNGFIFPKMTKDELIHFYVDNGYNNLYYLDNTDQWMSMTQPWAGEDIEEQYKIVKENVRGF